MCQSVAVELPAPALDSASTVAKTSRRPSSFFLMRGREKAIWLPPVAEGYPEENQLPHDPPGVVCQICHRSWYPSGPVSQTKASRCPSAFFPTEVFAARVPGTGRVTGVPSEVQL